MPGVEQGLLPAAFGLSSPVSRRQRGLQTGLCQLQRRSGRKRSQGESGTGGSDRAAHRPARLPGAVQNTWRGDRGLPFREGGKNNNLKAKKPGAAGSVFITVKKKALFPASPQRLFITHTRVWRKCSICWVQPSTHTAYKLRAFTCRVPEIKHTHAQKREEFCISPGALPLPGCPCAPAPAGPGSRSGIPHYLRPFPASSAGNSSASVFLQPHLESVTPGCQPSEPGGWHVLSPPQHARSCRPARRCLQALSCLPRRAAGLSFVCLAFSGSFEGAFVAAVKMAGRDGSRDPQGLMSAGRSCCGQGCSAVVLGSAACWEAGGRDAM